MLEGVLLVEIGRYNKSLQSTLHSILLTDYILLQWEFQNERQEYVVSVLTDDGQLCREIETRCKTTKVLIYKKQITQNVNMRLDESERRAVASERFDRSYYR